MPVFTYTALDRQGRQTTGTLPAENRIAAYDDLSAKGLAPISVDEQANGAAARKADLSDVSVSAATRVSAASLESFTRELANLLAAGLPLSRALQLLKREASQPTARKVWGMIHDDVVGGTSLADALAKWPRIFSTVYIAMVRAGEAGGFLHVVLQQIADFRVREQDLKGRVKAALVYPIILGILACAVLVFLLTFFIPKFSTIFAQFGGKLPWLTQMIVAASQVLMKYGPVLLVAVVIGIVALKRALGTEAGKRVLERIILKTPAVGKVTARFALVRFCRMLGTLVGAGVPLVAALRVAREALGNQTLADAVSHAIEEVQRGTPLSRSLAATPILFPASVVEMVAIAEETGRLDKELQRLSVSYEAELDRNLRMLVSLAEPLMLFITAIVIGTVVVGMLLPILTLQDIVH